MECHLKVSEINKQRYLNNSRTNKKLSKELIHKLERDQTIRAEVIGEMEANNSVLTHKFLELNNKMSDLDSLNSEYVKTTFFL